MGRTLLWRGRRSATARAIGLYSSSVTIGNETENGENLLYSLCTDNSVPVDVAFTHVAKQGYEFKGLLIYPEEPDTKFYVFLSPDEKTEVTINTFDDGRSWQILYQKTDPEDLPLIIPAVG